MFALIAADTDLLESKEENKDKGCHMGIRWSGMVVVGIAEMRNDILL
jgi:hypothetical protein